MTSVTWRRLVGELGLAGLVVPERLGGAGATVAEVAVVLQELGRMLLPVPYLSTVVVTLLLGQADATSCDRRLRPRAR